MAETISLTTRKRSKANITGLIILGSVSIISLLFFIAFTQSVTSSMQENGSGESLGAIVFAVLAIPAVATFLLSGFFAAVLAVNLKLPANFMSLPAPQQKTYQNKSRIAAFFGMGITLAQVIAIPVLIGFAFTSGELAIIMLGTVFSLIPTIILSVIWTILFFIRSRLV